MKEPFEEFRYELGKGWTSIAMEAVKKIEAIHNEYLENPPDWFEPIQPCTFLSLYGESNIAQVKQKFGELRIYTKYHSNEIDEIIREAEKECSQTCEICGANKEEDEVKRRSMYWYRTTCKKCWKKTNE